MKTVSGRLRALRSEAGLSARELSALAGLAASHVSHIETGKGCSSETLAEICRVLGVTMDWLYLGRGTAPELEAVRVAVARARRASAA